MPRILYQETSSSTNDAVAEFFAKDEIVCVFTYNQTKGRGQYGNSWRSEPGKNLAVSFCIPRNFVKNSEILFNYHTALIVRDFVAKLTDGNAQIKWPNDIILNNKKISGILIEGRAEFYIVGIGINILQENFENLPSAGSIFTQTGMKFNIEKFANDFIEFFISGITKDEKILNSYNSQLFRRGIPTVFEKENLRQNGIILFADEEGFLHIHLENDGEKKFRMKEIKMLY